MQHHKIYDVPLWHYAGNPDPAKTSDFIAYVGRDGRTILRFNAKQIEGPKALT